MSKLPSRSNSGSVCLYLSIVCSLLIALFTTFWLLRTPQENRDQAYPFEAAAPGAPHQVVMSRPRSQALSSPHPTQRAAESKALAPKLEELPSLSRANRLRDSGNLEASEAMLRNLQDADPENQELLFELAIIAGRDRDEPEEARSLLEHILLLNPAHIAAADELYSAYESIGDLEGSIRTLQAMEAQSTAASKPAYDYLLGRLALVADDPLEGRRRLERALREGGDDPLVQGALANAYVQAGDIQSAKQSYRHLAQAKVPTAASLNAQVKLAEILEAEGLLEAIRQSRSNATGNPGD